MKKDTRLLENQARFLLSAAVYVRRNHSAKENVCVESRANQWESDVWKDLLQIIIMKMQKNMQ